MPSEKAGRPPTGLRGPPPLFETLDSGPGARPSTLAPAFASHPAAGPPSKTAPVPPPLPEELPKQAPEPSGLGARVAGVPLWGWVVGGVSVFALMTFVLLILVVIWPAKPPTPATQPFSGPVAGHNLPILPQPTRRTPTPPTPPTKSETKPNDPPKENPLANVKWVTEPAFIDDEDKRIYLSDLSEFNVKEPPDPWRLGKNGLLGDTDRKRIVVNGKLALKGLCTHPNATTPCGASWRIEPAETFQALVGINDSAQSPSEIVFEVLGDGKLLWKSAPVKEPGKLQDCRVSVRNVSILELKAATAPFKNQWAHAVWIDPYIIPPADLANDSRPRRSLPKGEIPWESKRAYLADLTEFDYNHELWTFKAGHYGRFGDIPIRLVGKPSPKSLSLGPPGKGTTMVRYRLNREAAILEGTAAVEGDGPGIIATMTFFIHGDGKLLNAGGLPVSPGRPAKFQVSVRDVDILELSAANTFFSKDTPLFLVEPMLTKK